MKANNSLVFAIAILSLIVVSSFVQLKVYERNIEEYKESAKSADVVMDLQAKRIKSLSADYLSAKKTSASLNTKLKNTKKTNQLLEKELKEIKAEVKRLKK